MPKRPYNLFLMITDFTHGGSERQFVEIATRLDPQRFRVRVGCLARRGSFAGYLDAHVEEIREFKFPSLASSRALGQGLRLARLLRAQRTDLVHAFDFYTNLFGLPAARLAGVPAVVASRRDTGSVWSPWRRFALRQAFRLADALVTNSEAAAHALREEGVAARRIRVIRNGVDLAHFCPNGASSESRRRLGLPEDARLVATVAVLRAEKDHETLLAAVPAVVRRVPSAHFLIVGAGPAGPRLQVLAAAQGLSQHVTFLGDRADVADLLQTADVFVLPSLTESLPNSVLEAMSVGLPVVATAVGGVPELVEPGRTGFLVPPRHTAALADRIALLLERPALRAEMGKLARARSVAEFGIAQSVRCFEALYEELLQPRGGRPS